MYMKEAFENPVPDPTILMQAKLLERHPDWIDAHAAEFRKFIDTHPDIVERYQERPQETVNEIESKFYH